MLSRHVNFFQRKNSLRGRKIFPRRRVGKTMQILPTIVEKAYQLAKAWSERRLSQPPVPRDSVYPKVSRLPIGRTGTHYGLKV